MSLAHINRAGDSTWARPKQTSPCRRRLPRIPTAATTPTSEGSSTTTGRLQQDGEDGESGQHFQKKGPSQEKEEESNLPLLKSALDWSVRILIAIGLGYLHSRHVSMLFESDRHFSHLSTLEREMGFRTEMGLYYSYFKTIVEAPTFLQGLEALYYNNVTEFPDTINTLKRFNLYPEVVLGAAFRAFTSLSDHMKWRVIECWRINRGDGLSPVTSCDGLGDPATFYVNAVWAFAALTTAALFLIATKLSSSIFGGLLCVLCFFYNHGESTRVQWTPPLRESFGYPVLLVQMLAVTYSLRWQDNGGQTRTDKSSRARSFAIALPTCCFILFWQFAQFVLFTQLCSVFALFIAGVVSRPQMKTVLDGITFGLLASLVLMFGNEMLFASWFFAAAVAAYVIVETRSLENIENSFIRLFVLGSAFVVFTVGIKMGLSTALGVSDDSHISDIFRSKFSDFRNFDTMLYTCAKEFDFLGMEMPMKTTETLLMPSALVATAAVVIASVADVARRQSPSQLDAAVLYHVLQTAFFALMAIIIMRLKLFFTPHLCILAGLLASEKFFKPVISSRVVQLGIIVALASAMSVKGIENIKHQRSIMGEYSNIPMEQMIEWINTSVGEKESLAGPMAVMANLLLSTRRPIVNHPHYEDALLRAKTKTIYRMFSRRTFAEVHAAMLEVQAGYLVLSADWCLRPLANGCGMTEIWDTEEPQLIDKEPVCPKLWNAKKPAPFKRVFANEHYVILKV